MGKRSAYIIGIETKLNEGTKELKKAQDAQIAAAAGISEVDQPTPDDHATHYSIMGRPWDRPNHTTGVRDAASEAEGNAPRHTCSEPENPPQRPILEADVLEALRSVGSRNSATGADKVKWEAVRLREPSALAKLFQFCVEKGEIPTVWQLSMFCPIENPTTNPGDPTTYKGISLVSCLLKLLMKVMTLRGQNRQTQEISSLNVSRVFKRIIKRKMHLLYFIPCSNVHDMNTKTCILVLLTSPKHSTPFVETCCGKNEKARSGWPTL